MAVGIIILAAGESRRMGLPKQLLDINGKSMLKSTVDEALTSEYKPVTVVVGARKEKVMPELSKLPINIVENPLWQTGMASSILRGLAGTYLIEKNLDAVLIMTCDMPEVSAEYIQEIVKASENTDKVIVASQYQKSIGVPALFKKEIFHDLLGLKGDAGARQIFKAHKDDILAIPFPGLGLDIDTKEDYLNYIDAQD
ncbi:MAG: molybdenum cofactor cytidylyltransferase [Arcticibacterium sp.]|jgi:molybdenum cofactor cytidylyltransferase